MGRRKKSEKGKTDSLSKGADPCPLSSSAPQLARNGGGFLERPGPLPEVHSSLMFARPGKKLSILNEQAADTNARL